jgi:post-segregation antitoxin (ccd killing protein)
MGEAGFGRIASRPAGRRSRYAVGMARDTKTPPRDEKRRGSTADEWGRDNARAIAEYNEHVAQHGLFSDRWRTF